MDARAIYRSRQTQRARRAGCLGLVVLLAAAAVITSLRPDPAHVSRAEFGDEWPLTVAAGQLECHPILRPGRAPLQAVTIKVDGILYALNGWALTYGAPKLDPIWAVDNNGDRKSVGALLMRGLALCK